MKTVNIPAKACPVVDEVARAARLGLALMDGREVPL